MSGIFVDIENDVFVRVFFFSFRCFVCIYLTMVIHSKFAVTIF